MLSLFLNNSWDISLDSCGNIATASKGYAAAQSVANAVKLFTNDAYFNTERGIPHFETSLKRSVSASIVRSRIKETAETVPGVKTATVNVLQIKDNTLQAEILITLTDNETAQVVVNI